MICNARPVHRASVAKVFAPKARTVGRNSALKVQAYKITLDTPDGAQEFECDGDTYILDKAEVRTTIELTIVLIDHSHFVNSCILVLYLRCCGARHWPRSTPWA